MTQTGATKHMTIHLEVPADVPLSEHQAREILIMKLVEEGFLSQSEGARLLNISRAELIERMAQAHMATVRYTAEDLAREQETLQWLRQHRALGSQP